MLPLSDFLAGDCVAVVSCAVSAFFDLRVRRIPNWLTASTAIAGLCAQLLMSLWISHTSPWPAIGGALAAGAVALLSFFPLSHWGVVGFGDTKLLGAIGICVGWPLVVRLLVCTLLSGGVIALFYGLITGQLRGAFTNLMKRVNLGNARIDEPGHGLHEMPFGLAIALGTLWAIASRYHPALSPLP